jgi:hypothetical protein
MRFVLVANILCALTCGDFKVIPQQKVQTRFYGVEKVALWRYSASKGKLYIHSQVFFKGSYLVFGVFKRRSTWMIWSACPFFPLSSYGSSLKRFIQEGRLSGGFTKGVGSVKVQTLKDSQKNDAPPRVTRELSSTADVDIWKCSTFTTLQWFYRRYFRDRLLVLVTRKTILSSRLGNNRIGISNR